MKNNNLLSWLTSGVAFLFTNLQPDDLLKWISLGLTILSVIISIIYNIWKWSKEATKDGRITPEEIKELGEIIDDAKKDIKEIKDNE